MKLSIIIVNYQSLFRLKNCLKSLMVFLPKRNDFEVIVINNDFKKIKLADKFTFPLKIIENRNNDGFGKSNNHGAKIARGKFLFFLNPDTQLVDTSLDKALAYLEKNPSVGILGPKIIDAQRKTPQPWTSGKKTTLLNIIFRNTFNKSWNKSFPVEVAWVSGTALLIDKKYFNQLSGFDEKFFMYFEDQDLCLRFKKKINKKIIFYPLTQILHYNGQSWDNKKHKKNAYIQSRKYFFQKHNSFIENWLLNILEKIFKK